MDASIITMAEEAIIGTMINCPGTIGIAMRDLAPADFTQLGCRGLYEAAADLFLAGSPVDAVTVLAKAGAEYKPMLDACVGHYRPEDMPYLVQLVLEQSRLRHIRTLADKLGQAEDLDAARAILDRLNGASVMDAGGKVTHIRDAVEEFLAQLAPDAAKPEFLELGIRPLDSKLMLERGDFMVVGGYPSAGKTLLSIQMAAHLARKYRVGYFSLETRTKKLVDRLMAYRSRVPLRNIKRRDLTEQDLKDIREAAALVSALHLDSVDASGYTVRDIQATALAYRHEVIFVDYLQLVQSRGGSRTEEVSNISRGLHTLAQSNKITVVALAQLQRPQAQPGKAPTPPNMNSFRESGQIEMDADIALLLYPEDLNDNSSNRILKTGKAKESERPRPITMQFDGGRQTMTPLYDGEGTPGYYADIGKAAKQANHREAQRQMSLLDDRGEIDYIFPPEANE